RAAAQEQAAAGRQPGQGVKGGVLVVAEDEADMGAVGDAAPVRGRCGRQPDGREGAELGSCAGSPYDAASVGRRSPSTPTPTPTMATNKARMLDQAAAWSRSLRDRSQPTP